MVRDSVDIVSAVCGHYLRIGFERVHFIDDSSSDGTYELLTTLAGRTGRVSVERVVCDSAQQPQMVSAAANAMIADGSRTIVPFDADEFWDLDRHRLGAIAKVSRPREIRGVWVNFVQDRRCEYPRPFGLLGVRHRAEPVPGAGRIEVSGLRHPFVAIESVPKVAVWTTEPVRFDQGHHRMIVGPRALHGVAYDVLHIPLRWRSELTKRALNYEPRRASSRLDRGQSWQSQFHRRVVLEGADAEVWAANSADRAGNLDVYGRPWALVRDDRLRRALTFAAAYMLVRHRVVAL